MTEAEKKLAEHTVAVEKARAALARTKAKSLLDPSFRYSASVETDLRKTFARARRAQRAQQAEAEKVIPIKREQTK